MKTMAKKQRSNKPSIEAHAARLAAIKSPAVQASIPFLHTNKYPQREIHITLDSHQATPLRCVLEGLEEQHAKLNDGHVVSTVQDAIRWMLEQVGRAAGSQ